MIVVGWMLTERPLIQTIVAPFFFLFMVLGVLGAFQGILFAFKKLHVGCPLCRKKSHVVDGNKQAIWLDCPDCGRLHVTHGLVRLKITRCRFGQG
ncbi:hypothetical protein [Rariglobus hedericola]|uniref:Uncharacterized protein n=1 Tax=Rariglobus hedericola TaxID=2597822 RepID=A0A556QQ00_9BACT|nr:hypothetical protein [Rariglobus hedericola]TSJ78724.1 hypothetical protein FPL22_05300 [Rariglobus hedericola]